MNCPQCNRSIAQQKTADGTVVLFCEQCGWGKDKLEAAQQQAARPDSDSSQAGGSAAGVPASAWAKLCFWWVVSIVVVIGPYLLVRYALTAWLRTRGDIAADIADSIGPFFDVHYWWMIGTYLIIAGALSPKPMSDHYGLFGMPTVDNPLTLEDDFNRSMVTLQVLLIPGKIVWQTVGQTWQAFKLVTGIGAGGDSAA